MALFPICSIATLAVASNMRELYRLVLVDTPLAPYFAECVTSEVSATWISS
jgi:V-type H+-transporting ATPase subunit d